MPKETMDRELSCPRANATWLILVSIHFLYFLVIECALEPSKFFQAVK